MNVEEHYIECPRYGGKRLAPSCIHYDRYRFCRKTCSKLEKHIKEHPEVMEIVENIYRQRENLAPAKHTGHNAPVEVPNQCKYCGFKAKSERGLKAHYTRTHKEKFIPGK